MERERSHSYCVYNEESDCMCAWRGPTLQAFWEVGQDSQTHCASWRFQSALDISITTHTSRKPLLLRTTRSWGIIIGSAHSNPSLVLAVLYAQANPTTNKVNFVLLFRAPLPKSQLILTLTKTACERYHKPHLTDKEMEAQSSGSSVRFVCF